MKFDNPTWTQPEPNPKIEGWVGLGCKKFWVGLGYQSNQPELLGWVKKIAQPNPTWTMYTPTWCSSKLVERLVQVQYLIEVFVIDEARWLSDVDGLLQLSVEESGLHVLLVDLPRVMSRDRHATGGWNPSNLATSANTSSKSTPCICT